MWGSDEDVLFRAEHSQLLRQEDLRKKKNKKHFQVTEGMCMHRYK